MKFNDIVKDKTYKFSNQTQQPKFRQEDFLGTIINDMVDVPSEFEQYRAELDEARDKGELKIITLDSGRTLIIYKDEASDEVDYCSIIGDKTLHAWDICDSNSEGGEANPSISSEDMSVSMETEKLTAKIEELTKCAVCLNNEKNIVIQPCGHFCICIDCLQEFRDRRIEKCPICRGKIEDTIRIFMGGSKKKFSRKSRKKNSRKKNSRKKRKHSKFKQYKGRG